MINFFIRKYKTLSVSQKATIWYTFCNIIQKGISFLIIPIYTRMLTLEEYGSYSLFLSWRDILMIIVTMNLYAGVFTKLMVDNEDDRDACTSSIQTLGVILAIAYFLMFLVAKQKFLDFTGLDVRVVILLFLYFAVYPAFLYWSCRQCVEFQYVKMVCVTLLVAIAIPTVSLVLLLKTNLREIAVIFGYLFVQIIVGTVFFIHNLIKGKKFVSKKYWGYALKYNLPLILHYLSQIVLAQSDRIMIDYVYGEGKTAVYSLAAQISHVITLITSAIHTAFTPIMYKRLRDNVYVGLKNSINTICLIVGLLSFVFSLISPEIVRIMGSQDYADAASIIPVLMIGVFMIFVYGFFSDIEFYYGATNYVMIASLVGSLLNILLNWIFLPMFGYKVAAYTTMICYIVFVIMHFIFMKKVSRRHNFVYQNVFDIRKIMIVIILVITLMFSSIIFCNMPIVRYSILLVSVVVCFVSKEKIIEALRVSTNETNN